MRFCRQHQDAGKKAAAKGNVIKNTTAAQNGQLVTVSTTEQLFNLDNVRSAKEALLVVGQMPDSALVSTVEALHNALAHRQT